MSATIHRSVCDHLGTEKVHRTAHGYLGDEPAGTVQILCSECGAVVSPEYGAVAEKVSQSPSGVQLYVLPIPDGWAVVSYGDAVVPDDEIVPLPLTAAVSFDEAVSFVAGLPMAAGAMIDGWVDDAQLAALEPELAARVQS